MDKRTITVTMTYADFMERENFIEELKAKAVTQKTRYLYIARDYNDACSLLKYWTHFTKKQGVKLPLRSGTDRRFFEERKNED